jgi:3-hydroxyisobutyrate dehydrogenase-like beta-hydroxyacid dehydrogenase
MGAPIADRLLAAGHELRAYARRSETRDALAERGVILADSVAELASAVDVAIVCVYSDEQVHEIAFGPDGIITNLRAGGVLVNHTTGRPSTAEALSQAAEERSCAMLDAALSGGPADISAGRLTLLVGGDANVLENVRPLLATYSSPIMRVGRVGDGQRIKLLNNVLFGAHVALTKQLEDCAIQLGLDPSLTLAAIQECSADSFVIRTALATGSAEILVELAGRFIRKDVAVVAEVAGEMGVELGSLLDVAQLV